MKFVVPVDDIGRYYPESLKLVLANPHLPRATCPTHEGQPCAWRVGWWTCPVDGCAYRVAAGLER